MIFFRLTRRFRGPQSFNTVTRHLKRMSIIGGEVIDNAGSSRMKRTATKAFGINIFACR